MGLEDFVKLNRAQKAQFFQEEQVAIYHGEKGASIVRLGDFEKRGLLDGYFSPRYITCAALFPITDEKLSLLESEKADVKFHYKPNMRSIHDSYTATVSLPDKSFDLSYWTSSCLEAGSLKPLFFEEGPSVKDLKKAGRAIEMVGETPRLAVINKIYRGGGFAPRPLVSSTIYEIPEGMSGKDLLKVPVSELKYSTNSISVRRNLRLIA